MATMDMLPIGIENFEKIRTQGFYYVDKTGLIKELLENWAEANLFTRPRRFGKSLNMSMLKYFFEYGGDAKLFEGLAISREVELCEKYMGRYPVISISLKGVSGLNFNAAKAMLRTVIGNEAMRFHFLKESEKLESNERKLYQSLIYVNDMGEFDMPDAVLQNSLLTLSTLLRKHYGQKVILLIDEYDVPLDKAHQFSYYDEMIAMIRNLLGQTLKTNDSLQLAVLTGCLRVSKESIFTGLNNLRTYSIADVQFDEYFGFTDAEVQKLLQYYGLSDHYEAMKSWYDGYHFGMVDVYCPWDVINHTATLRADPEAEPEDYWSNASENEIVRSLLQKTNYATTKQEIERLIAGESIVKEIRTDLTYKDLDDTIENIWSVLYTTGYLTKVGRPKGKTYTLCIPNLEIRSIFTSKIESWFKESVAADGKRLEAFCNALHDGNVAEVEQQFTAYLEDTISIRDTFSRSTLRENFYHGILLGLVSFKQEWAVQSNRESGIGYNDIQIEIPREKKGIVIEVKYPTDDRLEAGCEAAMEQIETLEYDAALRQNGCKTILKYGVACYQKHCKVVVKKD